MRCFIHVDTGESIIRDHEGADYNGLGEAVEEAKQSARDLIVEELRHGRPLPLHWLMLVIGEAGNTVAIPFSSFALVEAAPSASTASFHDLAEHAAVNFQRAASSASSIRETVAHIRASISALATFGAMGAGPQSDTDRSELS